MYADVVVLTYQPPDIKFYTYEIPNDLQGEIKVGQLVSVPFGKRNPAGLVIHLRGEKTYTSKVSKNIQIKPIDSILFPTPVLLPYQIELLGWMSFYYHAPMVNCLETMLPPIPRQLGRFGQLGRLGKEQQTLVLVPSINHLPETLAKYRQAKNYAVYHHELKIREKFAVWQKILWGAVDYVFGSRSAIFTPCPALSKIIIYDEHDGAYKDERSPYYDTLTVAEKLQEFTGCKIQIIDTSPKVTTYYLTQNHPRGEISLHLGGEKTSPKPKVQIVSMLAEKAAGNRSPISDQLETYLKLGFKKNKRILLFLNKKKESGHVYCRSCKFSDFANVQPEFCPNCNSADIYFNTLNINSLATLIKKIVPNAGVNILTDGKRSTLNDQQLTIDIATSSVFYKLSPQKYDLVAAIATDSLLNITDFTAFERLYTQISDLKKLAKGLLVLQTYNPDHSVIKNAARGNYQQFFREQLRERKALSYPPFAQLIKLTLKGKKEEHLQKKSQELFDILNDSSLITNHSSLSILGPYKSAFQKALRYNIVLKVKTGDCSLSSRERVIKSQEKYFEMVPKDWQIIVEPDR